jgi:hypothetical protein
MNKNILQENKKRKILIINSEDAIIGLISLMGAIMTLTFVTLTINYLILI